MKKIIFMGTPDFSVPVLKTLIKEKYEIVMVITQPDRVQGRKKEIIFSPVKKIAIANNLKVFQPVKIKEHIDEILNTKADLIITAAYGQILPRKLIETIPAINVHGSLLPEYRGGAPIQYALFEGKEKTGITIMDMEFKMDSGDIILQEEVKILPEDNYTTLSEKLSFVGARLLVDVLRKPYKRIKQDEEKVTFAYTLKREDEFLDFSSDANNVINHLRGLLDEPAGSIYINDEIYKVYNIKKSDIIINTKPGEIFIDKGRLFVGTNSNTIEILEIQAPGKKRMKVKDFLNGQKMIKSGDFVRKKEGN